MSYSLPIRFNFVRIDHFMYVMIAFLASFSSLCYQLAIAHKLSIFVSEGLFVYPLSLAVFILCMGLGSFWVSNLKIRSESFIFKRLACIELILSIVGGLSVLTIETIQTYFPRNEQIVLVGIGINCLIGLLTGMELPFLLKLYEIKKYSMKAARRLIFIDYFASLVASLIFTLITVPYLGLIRTPLLVAGLNFIIFLVFYYFYKRSKITRLFYVVSLGILLSYIVIFSIMPVLERHLKKNFGRYYLGMPNLELVTTFRTFYQEVSLYIARKDKKSFQFNLDEVLQSPDDYLLIAFLDEQVQFIAPIGISTDLYHHYLLDPFMQIFKYKKILILGGGDGLPAKQALRYPWIEKIDMVDLDPEWVRFTQENPLMRLHSHDSLNHSKLSLYFSDAFQWVIKSKNSAEKKYDVIIIDFPAIDNLASIRTVTVQFLNDLKRILSPNGVIIAQEDGTIGLQSKSIIYSNYLKVGFIPLVGNGYDTSMNAPFCQMLAFHNIEQREKYLKAFRDYTKRYSLDKSNPMIYKGDYFKQKEPTSFYDPSFFGYMLINFYMRIMNLEQSHKSQFVEL